MAKFNQQSTGLHIGYRDPATGDVNFRINTDGTINCQGIVFGDGTIQLTAATAGGGGVDTVSSTSTSGSVTLPASTNVLVLATGGSGGITQTLPTAVGLTGQKARIKKVDSGVGTVTIATTSGQTIDGGSTYLLVNQWQYVSLESDGSNWQIVENN